MLKISATIPSIWTTIWIKRVQLESILIVRNLCVYSFPTRFASPWKRMPIKSSLSRENRISIHLSTTFTTIIRRNCSLNIIVSAPHMPFISYFCRMTRQTTHHLNSIRVWCIGEMLFIWLSRLLKDLAMVNSTSRQRSPFSNSQTSIVSSKQVPLELASLLKAWCMQWRGSKVQTKVELCAN